AGGGIQGELSLAVPDLSAALALAGISGVRGALSAEVSVAGTPARPTAKIDAGGKQLSLADLTLGDIRLEAGLNAAGTLEITDLTLANQGSRAAVRGRIDLLKKGPKNTMTVRPDLPVDLTLALESFEPADFIKDKGLEGQIDGTVTARGPVRAPDMQAEISGKELAVGGTRIGGVEARVRMADGSILLSPVTVVNGKSRAAISGTIDLMTPGNGAVRADPAIDIRVAGEPVFLEDFIDGMSGAVTLSGEIGGSISRPRGRAVVTGKKLALGGQAIDGAALEARMDGRSIVVDRFQVAVTPKETLDGSGSIDFERSAYDLRISSTGVSFASIDALAGIDGLNGKAALDISGRGTFSEPRAEGRVSVTGIRVNQEPVADIRLNLTVKDQTARARGSGGFDLDGRYHLKKKEFSASMGFDRTDLAPYFKIAGLGDMGGRIDGTVTADGRSDAPEKIRIAADLRNLTLLSEGREFLTSPRIFARMENRAFSVADTEIRLLKEGRITLGGQGNLAGTISMTVDGRIPFSVIHPFLGDEIEAGGMIIVNAGLGGTFEQPEISGAVILDRLGVNLPGLSQRLHDVTGRIAMSSKALVLEKIDGRVDGGSFTLGGRVDLENFKPVRMDLQAAARKLPIEVPDTLSLVIDSALSLNGTVEKSLLKGEIVLLEGRYFKDVELRPIRGITRKTREVAPEPAGGSVPFLANMDLGIVIQRREPFEVENNLADMRLSPDLRVVGTAERPVISGRAGVDEGVITYQAIRFQRAELGFRTTEFEIRKGVVDFLNPYRTEPTIDIESEASVRDWTITLKVSGTPDNLNFKLSSVPSEEDADILSLLLVGKTLKEMRQDDASGLSARQMLGDILAGSVSSGVKDATGLDIVELEYTEAADPDERDDVKVTLGKELSRRITVKYGAELKNGETVQKVISEYKILEALLVSAFQDTAGNFGGALTYRVEFW
ncbi:translocation/assembly module TamB domain-containing protein, partial [Desulfococcus sp.]|uniref:translocation/assembly module TamB domain-containing protein n=1 Tax=Desulfococcus sp. TaxID=2025834 RepID=UPI00359491AD